MGAKFKSCFRCKERTPGCHSTCPKHAKEKAEWEAAKLLEEDTRKPTLTPFDFNEMTYNYRLHHKRQPR